MWFCELRKGFLSFAKCFKSLFQQFFWYVFSGYLFFNPGIVSVNFFRFFGTRPTPFRTTYLRGFSCDVGSNSSSYVLYGHTSVSVLTLPSTCLTSFPVLIVNMKYRISIQDRWCQLFPSNLNISNRKADSLKSDTTNAKGCSSSVKVYHKPVAFIIRLTWTSSSVPLM